MLITNCLDCGFPHMYTNIDVERLAGLVDQLTAQELKIFVRMAGGLSNQQLAALLVVAERTVRFHLSNLMAKLGVDNRAQVAILASHWIAKTCRSGHS